MSGCKIHNNSDLNVDQEIHSLVDFTQNRLGFQNPPSIFLDHDEDNGQKTLGKTGYYDPETMEIHVYVTGRHPKDILRSIAHELVHHFQNEKGELTKPGYHGQGYAQKNPHLRNMELEANDPMLFRDWEDSLKEKQPTIYNEWRFKNMSTKQWKNQELNKLLLEKFGIKQEESPNDDQAKEVMEGEVTNESEGMSDIETYNMLSQKLMDPSQKLSDDEMRDLGNLIVKLDGGDIMNDPTLPMNEEDEEDDKEVGMNSVKNGYDKNPEVTKADFIPKKKDESLKEWKRNELSENLNKKWGFSMDLGKLKKKK